MSILETKNKNKLEVSVEPSENIKKLFNTYQVDWMDCDWGSLQQQVKDYSSEKVFIKEVLMPRIKQLSKLDQKEQIELDAPNKSELIQITQEREQKELLQKQDEVEKEYQKILEKIKTTPTPNIDKLTWEIREWIRLIISDKTDKHSLLLLGNAGLGKTTIIKSVLREFFNPEQMSKIIFKGHLTPLAYYNILYDNPTGIFFFDDISGIYSGDTGIALLKDSTETEKKRLVCYSSTSGKLEHRTTKFFFEGKQIFCMNGYPRSHNFLPVISRIRPIVFNPSYKEVIIMCYEIIKDNFKDIPLKDKMEVVEFIERNTDEATENFDLRLLGDFMDLFRHTGGINEKFVGMSKSLIKTDGNKELVIQLSKLKMPVKEQEKEFMETTHLSRATFYNYRRELQV